MTKSGTNGYQRTTLGVLSRQRAGTPVAGESQGRTAESSAARRIISSGHIRRADHQGQDLLLRHGSGKPSAHGPPAAGSGNDSDADRLCRSLNGALRSGADAAQSAQSRAGNSGGVELSSGRSYPQVQKLTNQHFDNDGQRHTYGIGNIHAGHSARIRTSGIYDAESTTSSRPTIGSPTAATSIIEIRR